VGAPAFVCPALISRFRCSVGYSELEMSDCMMIFGAGPPTNFIPIIESGDREIYDACDRICIGVPSRSN
jgi:hypothetical protein